MFNCISTVWDTETKLEVKTLQQFFFVEMSLYHSKLANWFISNHKLHPEKNFKNKKSVLIIVLISNGLSSSGVNYKF